MTSFLYFYVFLLYIFKILNTKIKLFHIFFYINIIHYIYVVNNFEKKKKKNLKSLTVTCLWLKCYLMHYITINLWMFINDICFICFFYKF
jgi:hypothetical protein